MIRGTARRLREWGGRRHAVIVVDDAPLLDRASSTLIAQLISDRLAFIILTARAGEPLADVLARLAREGRARWLELPPLPEPVMDRLIDHASPGSLDPQSRRRLHRLAQGNPLALRELLHGAEPGGLTELITSRLDGLVSGTRKVIDLVACGEPLPMSLLERLAGLDSVDDAEESRLIVVERDLRRAVARLDHPLYGEILRSRMPVSRAVRTYRELATALLETPLRRRGDVLLSAVWQVEAGVISRPDLVRDGAWLAIGHADLELAERLARSARDAEPCDEADRLLAEILAYRGRVGEAASVLPDEPPPDPRDRIAWVVTRAETLYWGSADFDAAMSTLDIADGHPLAEASRTWLLYFDARLERSVQAARNVLDRPDADPKARIWAATMGIASLGFLGRIDEAEAVHREGAALAPLHTDTVPWGVFEVETAMCVAHMASGNPARAAADADAGYRAVTQHGGAAMMASGWALYGGFVACTRGHLDEADRFLAEASAAFEANDSFRMAGSCLAAHAAVTALRGDPGATAIMARADELSHPTNKVYKPWVELWRAWVAYAARDLASAIAAARRAAAMAREAGMAGIEALALYEVARLGAKADLARLDAIGGDLARTAAQAARALSARDGAVSMLKAAADFHSRGYDLHAAELYTTAAHRHQRHGRLAHADLARAHADRLRAVVPGARTLLLQPAQFAGLLTAREREVVLLAAAHTSAEIAERLRLALPTVNNNLARAYTKLGITGRAQLRALLGEKLNQ
ncbi:MAG TPA: helix-turn-helix transcriptional regulator [Candidatus Limnocylindrales bacterium]